MEKELILDFYKASHERVCQETRVLWLKTVCGKLRNELKELKLQLAVGFKLRKALVRRLHDQKAAPGEHTRCVICLDAAAHWGMLHNNNVHLAMCHACVISVGSKCPVCRQPGSVVRVFQSGVAPSSSSQHTSV